MSYPSYDTARPRADFAGFSEAAAGHTPRSKPLDPPLHVLTAITNPCRFKSRYNLFADFAKRVQDAGAVLHVAEAAFGERPHEIPWTNGTTLQLRTSDEIWHKENLLNLLVQRLPADWKYCAWVDADVLFARPDWVGETIHQLQHYGVVQMFSQAFDLGPDETPFGTYPGFAASYHLGGCDAAKLNNAWHPGYAWAWRRDALEAAGGFIDTAILGAADRHMAYALIGQGRASVNEALNANYIAAVLRWEERAKALRHNIGYVPGAVMHHWHGRKAARGYADRWKILIETQFDPINDLRRDAQGLYRLHDDGSDRMRTLRDDVRAYFRSRNEDGIEL
jgi:hypothetical protein